MIYENSDPQSPLFSDVFSSIAKPCSYQKFNPLLPLFLAYAIGVLEAQQVGVPVVCSMTASLPEVVGEVAIYFNPLSVGEIAKAIGQVAQNPKLREELKEKGVRNARKYSWEQTARLTLEVYQKTVKC